MRNKTKFSLIAAMAAIGVLGSTSFAAAGGAPDAIAQLKPLYEVHTIAGSGAFGLYDGKSAAAAFREPTSLLYLPGDHSFLVADTGNQKLRAVTSAATKTFAGLYIGDDELHAPLGSLADGSLDRAAFNGPSGLAQDAEGNIYVADADNNAIRKIGKDGAVSTIAGDGLIGSQDGKGAKAEFNHPLDIAVAQTGVIYVADTLNHLIRQIKDGVVTTLNAPSTRIVDYFSGAVAAAGDYADGPIAQAKFNEPSGLALDARGNLYVSDTGNDVIRYIDFAAGKVTTVAGARTGAAILYGPHEPYAQGGYGDGAAELAKFHAPRGLAVTPAGGLLIADSLNHVIRYLWNGAVSTVAGTPGEEGRVDGLAGSATLSRPTDVVWIGGGAFAVADSGSHTIREVAPYAVPAGVKADGGIHLLYGSLLLKSDADPIIRDGVTYVPVRVLAEKLGYAVQYAGGGTTLSLGRTSYAVKAGSSAVVKTLQGAAAQTIKVNAMPFNTGGRLFLPVRFFAEELGLDVQWLPDVRAVLLREKQFIK